MKNSSLYFFSALFISASACTSTETKPSYYNIDSLMHAQVHALIDAKAVLTKQAEIDGKEESATLIPKDTTAWAHELDIFTDLGSINKPINAGNYKAEYGIRDAGSNLSIMSFTSLKELPVVYLKVFYLDTPSKVKRIEALYREENALLKGSRFLVMEFQEVNAQTILIAYTIEGGQKMFLGDSVKFRIKGTIVIP